MADQDQLDLIYQEILLREQKGEKPRLEEYLQRFPQLGSELRVQFEVDEALEAGELLASGRAGTAADGPPAGTLPEHPPGQWPAVADYKLLEVLGRGGMGVAYKAWQVSLKRLVALKMIRPGDAVDPEQRARFRTEAETVARLRHPNIVQVYAVGEHEGQPYLALEFVDTGSLAERLAGTPQPAGPTAQLVEVLARAMAYAHDHGVIHRDLKPANILLQRKSQTPKPKSQIPNPKSENAGGKPVPDLGFGISDFDPKISDFGLAKQLDVDGGGTQSGAIVGTPSYMAPEQAQGKVHDLGPPADIYALGVILYEALTGRPPFQGATPLETLEQVRSVEPVPLRQLLPSLARDLETICLKCLEKEPATRYATALDLAEDLRRFLSDRPILARRASGRERAWRWARRNKALASLSALLAGMAFLVTLGSIVTALRLERAAGQSRAAERVATERLFRSSLAHARALRQSEQMGRRWAALEAIQQAADLARSLDLGDAEILPLRNEAIACLVLADLRIEPEWQGSPPGCVGLAFDSSYDHYAQCSLQGRISLRRRADDREIRSLRVLFPAGLNRRVYMGFSPADRYLAAWFSEAARERPLYVWDLQNQTDRAVVQLTDATSFWSFSRDETQVAVAGPANSIRLYDLPGGKESRRLPVPGESSRVAFHPTGRSVAVASQSLREVQVLDLLSNDLVRLPHPAGVQGLAWTPDGKTLATGCMDGHIYLWDARSGSRRGDLQGHSAEVHDLSFSHGGDLLMSIAFDQTQRLWDPWVKKRLVTIPHARLVAFSRDDSFAGAIVQGNHIGLCRLVPSPEFRPFRGDSGRVYYCDIDSTGRLLVSSASDDVRLWDLANGSELALLDKRVTALFGPGTRSLLTYGRGKLRRWPIRASNRSGITRLHIGPAEELFVCGSRLEGNRICWLGQACQSVAVCEERQTVSVIDLVPEAVRRRQWRFPGCTYIASSPDGHWVAAGTYEGRGVRVWDAQSGELAREWDFGDADVAFSPDGRWLALTPSLQKTGAAECSFWRVGTWERGPAIALDRTSSPAEVAFSDDGRLVAVARSMTEIVLLDPNDLHEIATLWSREPLLIHRLQFSPDGGRLAVAIGKDVVAVWDLRLLWQELAQMGLGRGLPSLPLTAQTDEPLPLRVDVVSSTSQSSPNKP